MLPGDMSIMEFWTPPGDHERADRVRARWRFAGLLWLAVMFILETRRRRQLVAVYGPDGASRLIPRGMAEDWEARGKLRRAPDEVMRQELGLPPRIRVGADTDHTNLAGAALAAAE